MVVKNQAFHPFKESLTLKKPLEASFFEIKSIYLDKFLYLCKFILKN